MLDAPVLTLTGPADIDELSVSAGPKGRDATSGESGGDVSNHLTGLSAHLQLGSQH